MSLRLRLLNAIQAFRRQPEQIFPPTGTSAFLLPGALGFPNDTMELHPQRTRAQRLIEFTGWIYAAVNRIQQDISAVPWAIYEKRGTSRDDWIKLDSRAMRRIAPMILRPNETFDLEDVIAHTIQHLDLAGEAYWRLLPPGEDRPLGFGIIYPHWIEEPAINVDGQHTGWKVSFPGRATETVPKDEIIQIRYPHPSIPLTGASPVESMILSHDLSQRTRAYGSTLMGNNAVPALLLTSEQDIDEDQAKIIRQRWLDRHRNKPGEPGVLGKGTTAQILGLKLADIGLEVIDRLSRDHVLSAYGVPASQLGLSEDVNRAVAEANARAYQKNALYSRVVKLNLAINHLFPIFGIDPDRYAFELENPVQDDRELLLQEAGDGVSRTLLTVNEGRMIAGYPTHPDGDVWVVPAKATIVQAGQLGSPQPQPQAARSHIFEAPKFELVSLRAAPVQENLERLFIGELRRLFSREQKAVVAAFIAGFGRSAETRDAVSDALASRGQAWLTSFERHIFNSSEAGWSLASQQIQGAVDFNRIEDRALNRARRISAQLVQGISHTTEVDLRRIIAAGVEAGDGVDDIAARIRSRYDDWKGWRAKTIAKTETLGHVNFGQFATAKETADQSGRTILKTWVATFRNTRDSHADVHGTEIGLQERFNVGGASLRFPADRGPAEEVINCECTLAFRDVTE